MTDPPDLPLFAAARVRREAARRRRRERFRLAAIALTGLAAIGVTAAITPCPRLVWNASASAPIGLYAVSPIPPVTRGVMVIAWPPASARRLAAARHYLPINVPLVKRVAAVGGARVCAIGVAIAVDGRLVARRLARDAAGRPMPWWYGCRRLAADELLLLTDAPTSFDGRYFGPTRASDVVGKATPLWLR